MLFRSNEAQAKQNVNNNPLAMTKSALIARYSHIWPTVEADILSAAINGLSTHARAVKRGWNEAKAVEWARSKGKINESENSSNQIASTMPSMTNLPTVVHRI